MASQRTNLAAACSEASPGQLEKAARHAGELHFGRAISDAEWARAGLLELMSILRRWAPPVEPDQRKADNVILISQSKP